MVTGPGVHGAGEHSADTSELQLWVGCAGAETPLHHDEQENLFTQIRGRKQIVLFPSELYLELRPFPSGHPCDRQSMSRRA